MTKEKILIVDDETPILRSFSSLLEGEGYHTEQAETIGQAEDALQQRRFDLVLLDLSFPKESGLDLLRRQAGRSTPVFLVVSGQSEVGTALDALKLGAVDYLEKPVPPERLLAAVRSCLMLATSFRHRAVMADQADEECRLIGNSAPMRKLLEDIGQAAPSDASVLITGPNGTGKELVATRLHLQSNRREKPLIKVNCPGVPETLFESELFGHRKGAFTGAVRDYPGKFVLADGGTLLLDEIGDLPLPCQAKLLRVLETGEVETLGAAESSIVDVRVICATNRSLEEAMDAGKFRQDLYYRISVFHIEVPPLEARRDDIPLLTAEFLGHFDPSGRTSLAPEAMAELTSQPWPGNVRQLRNVIERLSIVYSGRRIGPRELASQVNTMSPAQDRSEGDPTDKTLNDYLEACERRLIAQTLADCRGNISQAARRLGVDRANLSRKVKQYGLKTK